MILRSVNYTQKGAKIFNTTDSTGVFRTRNFLLSYDQNFTLLSQQEIEEVDGVVYLGLGQFNVADTEKCLDRFFQEDIRFKLNQNDDAMEQTMPIVELTGGNAGTARLVEILVHPDDEKRASEIVAECIKIN